MKKNILVQTLVLGVLFLVPHLKVFAHVTVTPKSAGVGAWQTFIVNVPNEKDQLVNDVRLVIPTGLKHVTPNVKPGWTIDIKKEVSGDDTIVTALEWHGGIIPVGQRDEFGFSAQVPATPGDLQWKAYQTYQDGTVIAWDQDSTKEDKDDESSNSGPLSITHVVDDLSKESITDSTQQLSIQQSKIPLILSIVAVAISSIAFLQTRKK